MTKLFFCESGLPSTLYRATIYMGIDFNCWYIFGVTKFYLYNQGSADGWQETIQDFIDAGIAVVINWNFSWMLSIRHQVGN